MLWLPPSALLLRLCNQVSSDLSKNLGKINFNRLTSQPSRDSSNDASALVGGASLQRELGAASYINRLLSFIRGAFQRLEQTTLQFSITKHKEWA